MACQQLFSKQTFSSTPLPSHHSCTSALQLRWQLLRLRCARYLCLAKRWGCGAHPSLPPFVRVGSFSLLIFYFVICLYTKSLFLPHSQFFRCFLFVFAPHCLCVPLRVVSLFYLQISTVMSSGIYVGFCDQRHRVVGLVVISYRNCAQLLALAMFVYVLCAALSEHGQPAVCRGSSYWAGSQQSAATSQSYIIFVAAFLTQRKYTNTQTNTHTLNGMPVSCFVPCDYVFRQFFISAASCGIQHQSTLCGVNVFFIVGVSGAFPYAILFLVTINELLPLICVSCFRI